MLKNEYEVLSLEDIGCTIDIPETGDTLKENAYQKAQYVWENYNLDCFADDTGLIVNSLNGEPGVYSARYAGEHKNSEDTESSKYTLQGRRQWKLSSQWTRTLSLRYEAEDFRQGQQRDYTNLLLPGISFTRDRTKGGLNVTWGERGQFYLEVSDPIWGSDVRLAKIRGVGKLVRTAGERFQHKFIARADLGAILVESIYDVPASMRFFAGGDQSIRGFSYESIAPRDEQGLLIGGRYLSVGSLEYGYLVLKDWRLAGFVDFGTATNDFSEPVSIGSGVGLRWITPIGPLRLDLAFALSEPGKPWMIHFSMGPDI